ncbi:MAG: phage/plasmid primase, P4 family [Devosia sp.]
MIDALGGLCFRERQAFSPPAWFDRTDDDPPPDQVLACSDVLLNIANGEVLPLTPRFFTYNGLPYSFEDPDFDPGPTNWLAFLDDIWPDSPESIQALQEIFGYLLTADTSQQKIFLIVGPPRSGKGTIGRVLTAMLGKDNCTSPSLKALGKDFGMESMIGKQLMLVSDMRLSRNSDSGEITGNILRISGEDDVNVSRKFKSDWVGKLPTRMLFLSNVPLILPDMSGALINRIVPLVLKKSFLGSEDTKLTDKLLGELPSILNWSIAGWKRLKARGHFDLTPQGLELNKYAGSHAAPVQSFLHECCEVGAGMKAPKQRVYDAFRVWARENDVVRELDQPHFSREMLIASGYTIETFRPRAGNKQVPHYAGLRLIPEWDNRADEARALYDFD